MKVIIAGSRSITNLQAVLDALWNAGFLTEEDGIMTAECLSEVVSGTARGVDRLGEDFAASFNLPVKKFPAAWDNLTVPGALIRTRPDGSRINIRAGIDRNAVMADYADAAVILWDGVSSGTLNMANQMATRRKPHFFVNLRQKEARWIRFDNSL